MTSSNPKLTLEGVQEQIDRASEALKCLQEQVNHTGVATYLDSDLLVLDYLGGIQEPQASQIRTLANSFKALADSYERRGVHCTQRLPADQDANEHGMVEWLRSGRWMRGPLSDQPVDATHWRRLF